VRELERDGEHIWLRQSVTFTVDGQTRTLEIAVPLRPGATAGEVDALLREAHAGMARLTHDLDAQVAAIANGAPLPAPAAPATLAVPAALPPAPGERSDTEPQPDIPTEAGAPSAPTRAPAPPEPAPAATPPPTTATTSSAPAAARAEPSAARAEPSAARAEPSAPRARPSGPLIRETPAPAAPVGPPIDLREFLSTARSELDLTPPQIMSRLGVKSLSGINYREALENLRRQALRGDGTTAPQASAPQTPPRPEAAASAPQPVRYFEEELDEPEVTFSLDGDDAHADEAGPYAEEELDLEGDEDEELARGGEEEDVPDFGPPPAPVRERAAPRAAEPAAPSAAPSQPGEGGDGGERPYAVQLLGQLRGVTPGGTPSTQQRTAFRNIVVQELGAEKAKAVVQGLYRVALERLGPEQLDALISWGKRDTFAEDADLVLAALRAERERAANAANGATPPAPATPPNGAASRPPARGRPASRPPTV
jgi:hypothetical protein